LASKASKDNYGIIFAYIPAESIIAVLFQRDGAEMLMIRDYLDGIICATSKQKEPRSSEGDLWDVPHFVIGKYFDIEGEMRYLQSQA
jgi:hypothetical protein